jgi:hypothetical protein
MWLNRRLAPAKCHSIWERIVSYYQKQNKLNIHLLSRLAQKKQIISYFFSNQKAISHIQFMGNADKNDFWKKLRISVRRSTSDKGRKRFSLELQ